MRNSHLAYGALAVGLTAFCAAPLPAATIYDNGTPNHFSSLVIQAPQNVAAADDLELSSSAQVESVTFYYDYNINDPIGSLQYAFYDSNSNAPGNVLESGMVANLSSTYLGTFNNGSTFNEWVATFDVTPLMLGPGEYFLSLGLATQSTPNAAGNRYGWETAPVNSSASGAYYDPGTGFQPFPNPNFHDLAFSLQDTQSTPEPGSFAMLGLGLAVCGAAIKTRRNGR